MRNFIMLDDDNIINLCQVDSITKSSKRERKGERYGDVEIIPDNAPFVDTFSIKVEFVNGRSLIISSEDAEYMNRIFESVVDQIGAY